MPRGISPLQTLTVVHPDSQESALHGALHHVLSASYLGIPPATPRWRMACFVLQVMSNRRTASATTTSPSSTAAPSLTPLARVAFVGRTTQLAALEAALERAPLVVVTGAAGSGKTALARQFVARTRAAGVPPAVIVCCAEGDLACAVVARAERALDAVPGSLAQALATSGRMLVLDELHRLTPEAAARLLSQLAGPEAQGRLLALSRDVLPLPPAGATRVDVPLDGLAEAEARALWSNLEVTFGAAPAGACDAAIERTRGVPLAMRREFARSRSKKAWEPAAWTPAMRKVLAAAAVLRVPATHAALMQLAPAVNLGQTLAQLGHAQLIDAIDDGRFEVHDVVRGLVLEALSPAERRALEAGAAALFDEDGRKGGEWERVDGAGLAVSDPIDRLREGVLHLAAAGKLDRAETRLAAARGLLTRRGGSGEALAIIARLEHAGERSRALTQLRAELLAGAGLVAEARDAYDTLAAEHGDKLDKQAPEVRLALAELALASGEPQAAETALAGVIDHIKPEIRARAQVLAAEVALERGDGAAARKAVRGLDGVKHAAEVRAQARLVVARADVHEGAVGAAGQLARVVATSEVPLLAARAAGLAAQAAAQAGRFEAADADLERAERLARGLDAPALGDELRALRSEVALGRGHASQAGETLRQLTRAARERGAERAALATDLTLAGVLVVRGRVAEAARLAAATAQTAEQRGLAALAVAARLCEAQVAVAERRDAAARELLGRVLANPAAAAAVRQAAQAELTMLDGQAPAPTGDSLADAVRHAAWLATQPDRAAATRAYEEAAAQAALAGRPAVLATALAELSRLALAAGRPEAAHEAAARAITEGVPGGIDRAVARALIVRAAVVRDGGAPDQAVELADAAHTIAAASGLAIETSVAATCAEACARQAGDELQVAPLAARRRAAAATLSPGARSAAEAFLVDLGLSSDRPFRVGFGAGAASYVAEIDARALGLDTRSLVIDGAREQVIRQGSQVADLRRRSLLKRLLFLFAGAPGRTFTKEDIVRRVWGVEYHPLRHDAALFTNIMRLRRLIGADGEEILRATDGGYRLAPPEDFIFVERVGA